MYWSQAISLPGLPVFTRYPRSSVSPRVKFHEPCDDIAQPSPKAQVLIQSIEKITSGAALSRSRRRRGGVTLLNERRDNSEPNDETQFDSNPVPLYYIH